MSWTPLSQANAVDEIRVVSERTTFDLKRTYDLTLPTTRFEIAKDVVAFANNLGGTILVGSIEGTGDRRGRPVAFQHVPVPGEIVAAVDDAIRMCLPVPVATPVLLTLDEVAQEAILGRQVRSPADLVAINVPPMLATPVGAPVCDAAGNRIADAYKFPIRRVEGTRYLRPEELVFTMNSHDRQVLLQLDGIPEEARKLITVWSYSINEGGRQPPMPCRLAEVDPLTLTIRLERMIGNPEPIEARVPITFVRAVWQVDGKWNLSLDGMVFVSKGNFRDYTGFLPPGSMW